MSNRKAFICKVPGCGRKHCAKGYCTKHYYRWKTNGDPLKTKTVMDHPDRCTMKGCNRKYYRKGLCSHHYNESIGMREYNKRYWASAEHKENRKRYVAKRREEELFVATVRMRNRIKMALRHCGYKKNSKTKVILGESFENVWRHLLATWEDNYGQHWNGEPYHIDHIKPISTAKTENEMIKLFHYTNLQMLTPEDNRKKGNKWGP